MKTSSLLIAALVLVFASTLSADTLRLRDGRVIEGTIVEETRSRIVIDAVISNISTRMTFSRFEIESIEKGDPPATPAAAPPAPATRPTTSPTTKRDTTPREQYLTVPIVGTFGEQVGPTGVRDALTYAARRNIRHVVFEIDSPGGQVWAAEEISRVMAERDDSIRCYAVIDHAISAAIWVALSCDEIFIRPGGTIGGAVAYRHNNSTGAVEVDAKLNSILAAKLEGISARHDHPPQIARAMVVYDASLYAETHGDGSVTLYSEQHEGATELDGPETVLTLAGRDAQKYGLAALHSGTVSDLGDTLGIDGWTLASEYGAAAMRRGQKKLRERAGLYSDRERLYSAFTFLVERIEDTSPENATYQIYEGGTLTSHAMRQWKERTDHCLNACRELADTISSLDRLAGKASRLGITDFIERKDVNEWKKIIQGRIDELERNRNRTRL